MTQRLLVLLMGFALDLIFGDPLWLPHPVQGMGFLISKSEQVTRKLFLKTPRGERLAGALMALVVVGLSTGIAWAVIVLAGMLYAPAAWVVQCIICYQMLATKSLRVESMKVCTALETQGLDAGRKAVSMIVGRDTQNLSEEEVIAAAVETVAENASDGILAPMLWMAVFGPLGGVFYKAINTMDSMVGYKNQKYRYFGTVAARLDDAVNWIPARISGVLMCICAAIPVGVFRQYDGWNALKVFLRDRRNHSSPNSAHTEAACAGAMGLQLGGAHYYFGKLVEKPTIGDAKRKICREDILCANRLVFGTAVLALILFDLLPLAYQLVTGA